MEKINEEILKGWLVVTVLIGIFAFATMVVSFATYPHLGDNPNLAKIVGYTEEELQTMRTQSELLLSISTWSFGIFGISLFAFLMFAWLLGYFHW